MAKLRSIKTLPLDGGTLAFHFINTVNAWRGVNLHEYLSCYGDFLVWSEKVELMPVAALNQLKRRAAQHPVREKKVFQQILRARSVFYSFFSGLAAGQITPAPLHDFNILLKQALPHFSWIHKKNTVQFSSNGKPDDLLLPLWLIVKEAHDLLVQGDRERMKECPKCGWIFLDATKNNQRRWCNPSTCGSVEKLRKYYRKHKSAGGAEPNP